MLIVWAWVMCPSQNWAGWGLGVRSLHRDHEEVIAQRKNHSAIIRRRGMDTGWASPSKRKVQLNLESFPNYRFPDVTLESPNGDFCIF